MKKKFLLFLIVAALFAMLAIGALAACEHNWIEQDGRILAKCEVAGSIPYKCSKCEATKSESIPALEHDWEKTATVSATCTEKGETTYTCSVCKDTKTEPVEALGHTYKEVSKKSTAATCTAAGDILYECSRCKGTKTEQPEALGHDFTKLISTSATCTEKGKTTYQCSRCDELILKDEVKLGHDYEKSGGPTCTEKGKYTYTCTRCKYSYTASSYTKALGHDLPDDDSSSWRVTKKATCTETGKRRAYCSRCKEYIYDTIEATGHDYSGTYYLLKVPTSTSSGKYKVTCADCSASTEKTLSKGTTNFSKYTMPSVEASVSSGPVDEGSFVELSCECTNATIYYTTNGKSPTSSSSRKEYTGAIEIDSSMTLKAYAVYEGNDDVDTSATITRTYTVKGEYTWLYLNEDASDGGYMSLEKGKKFRPDDKATRYEVIDAMDNLFDSWADDADIDFTDVDKEHEDAVAKFVGAELIDGYDDKTFRGEANIKRSELAKLLVLALGLDLDDAKVVVFPDVEPKHWAYDYISVLSQEGYLKGDTEGNFRPDDNITRAELATVMNRVADIDRYAVADIADVDTGHWAYMYICAAVTKK